MTYKINSKSNFLYLLDVIALWIKKRNFSIFDFFSGYYNDLLLGVRTEGLISQEDLGFKSSVGVRFEVIRYNELRAILSPQKHIKSDHFCDIGYGTGRSFIVAKELGYNFFYGCEIAPDLDKVCKENILKLGISADIKNLPMNLYKLPDIRDALTIYLFNSIFEKDFKLLLSQINLRKHPTILVYANPVYSKLIDPQYFLKSINFKKIGIDKNHRGIYSSKTNIYLFN
jgi:hypothetical protein